MKVKKRKKDNKTKYIIAVLLIIFALGGCLFWNHQQNKYVASVKAGDKKLYDGDGFTAYTQDSKIGTTASEKCVDAIKTLGVSVINASTYVGSDGNEHTNIVNKNNLYFEINCVPKEEAFADITNDDSFPFTVSGVKGGPVEFSCSKSSSMDEEGEESTRDIQRSSSSVKTITITNKKAFNYNGASCPANSVSIVYELDKVADNSPDTSDYLDEEVSQQTITDEDGEQIEVDLEGDMTIEDEGGLEVGEESESSDDTSSVDGDNQTIDGDDNLKINKFEVVSSLGKDSSGKKYGFSSYRSAFFAQSDWKERDYNLSDLKLEDMSSKALSMTCNYKLTKEDVKAIEDYNKRSLIGRDGKFTYYYYDSKNTHYYRATKSYPLDAKVTYYYHSIPHTSENRYRTETQPVKCTKTCTEIVKVEYGPPVQVAGGMCFEYRVKVSSIVKCSISGKDVKYPSQQSKYCKLKPKCGKTGHAQGGPTEDFEACVQDCDGGQYTELCSNKCYNEVYGGDLSLTSVEDTYFSDGTAPENYYYTVLVNNDPTMMTENNAQGRIRGQYYYDTKRKRYDWCPTATSGKLYISNNGAASTLKSTKNAGQRGYLGLWYYIQKYKTNWLNGHNYQTDAYGRGFIRAWYGNHKQCTEDCSWNVVTSGCGKNSYFAFNYNISNKRDSDNKVKTGGSNPDTNKRCPKMYVYNYQCAKYKGRGSSRRCASWVEPTNKEDRKYVKKNVCTQKDLILYDYLNNKKRLSAILQGNCNSKVSCTTSTAEFNIEFKYQNNETKKIVRVNFPYDDKENKTDKMNSKPSGQEKMNWNNETVFRYGGCYRDSKNNNWYLSEWTFPGTWITSKRLSTSYGSKPSNNYTLVRGSVCLPLGAVATNAKWAQYFNKVKLGEVENIDDSKWEFNGKGYDENTHEGYNIKAHTKAFGYFKWEFTISCFYALNTTTNYCLDPPCSLQSEIRSVDTSDPFLQKSTQKNIEEQQKRGIGFNWTADATLENFHTGGYNQNPEELIKNIESTDTFSETNLDYEVTLTPERLKEIRGLNKEAKSYAELLNPMSAKELYNADNGLSHYFSQLLKDYGLEVNNCNNKQCNVKKGGQ